MGIPILRNTVSVRIKGEFEMSRKDKFINTINRLKDDLHQQEKKFKKIVTSQTKKFNETIKSQYVHRSVLQTSAFVTGLMKQWTKANRIRKITFAWRGTGETWDDFYWTATKD